MDEAIIADKIWYYKGKSFNMIPREYIKKSAGDYVEEFIGKDKIWANQSLLGQKMLW